MEAGATGRARAVGSELGRRRPRAVGSELGRRRARAGGPRAQREETRGGGGDLWLRRRGSLEWAQREETRAERKHFSVFS
jgi:hypothetical protein